MEENSTMEDEAIKKLYEDAIELMVNQKMKPEAAKNRLIEEGADETMAIIIVANVESRINPSSSGSSANKEQAYKNMGFGALWCVGGIIATAADVGFIFYGAIVFGGIQFIIGAIGAAGD
ncbi:MAG: hypothetical protein QNK23_16040 [Crocinitomicaceae bacterium]|nr:hypothetical protein [Crocinitomicaceae bacterium]